MLINSVLLHLLYFIFDIYVFLLFQEVGRKTNDLSKSANTQWSPVRLAALKVFFALLMIYNIEDPWIRIYNIMRIYESGLRRQVPKLKNKTLQKSCFLIKKSKRLYCRSSSKWLSIFKNAYSNFIGTLILYLRNLSNN